MRWVFVIAVALVCQACVNQTELAKQALEAKVLHTNNITYRKMENYPGKVVCGEFNIKRKTQDKNFNPFIYRLEAIDTLPAQNDRTIFCSPDPIASLYEASGINYGKKSISHLSRIGDDFKQLGDALDQYEADNFMLPKTAQGLVALLRASDINPRPRRFKPGGYLDKLPLDPWNRPYLYTRPRLAGGVKGSYIIQTLGADGKPGGVNDNADIGSNQLKYLIHVEKL